MSPLIPVIRLWGVPVVQSPVGFTSLKRPDMQAAGDVQYNLNLTTNHYPLLPATHRQESVHPSDKALGRARGAVDGRLPLVHNHAAVPPYQP